MLAVIGRDAEELRSAPGRRAVAAAARARRGLDGELGIGPRALAQVLEALELAGRDAREELPGPLLVDGSVRSLAELTVGMRIAGVVRNVTPFGCFVNVGLKEDGLLHVSQMRGAGIDKAHVGWRLDVIVLNVDLERRKLSLGMALPADRAQGGSGQNGKRARE